MDTEEETKEVEKSKENTEESEDVENELAAATGECGACSLETTSTVTEAVRREE